jgi:hypothetical protein
MKAMTLILIGGFLFPSLSSAEEGSSYVGSEEWQMRRLLEPTAVERADEEAGRIFIYDGLSHADIENALDTEFERMESMMFIRVKKEQPAGEPLAYEDDGC